MRNKLYCSPQPRTRAIRPRGNTPWVARPRGLRRAALLCAGCITACILAGMPQASAGDAPAWMHTAANAPVPSYDEKTDAVLLYSETNVTVLSTDKVRMQVREAYKILRPNGRNRGTVWVYFNPQRKVKSLHGWCIPAQGKDYEVKDKDAIEVSPNIEGAEYISDTKYKVLRIPAPEPGNIVGYEYEVEEQPLFLQDIWSFQERDPVLQSRYSLQLPQGWEYKVSWLNHPEVKPAEAGNNSWQWTVNDLKGIRSEPLMPPVVGVSAQMIVSFFTSSGGPALNANASWNTMGKWYWNLVSGRTDASPEIKQRASTLTTSKAGLLPKMQALAYFVQHDIRYVAIELGIGGLQPHSAAEVFSHHYGDCKDKATLMRSMLHEIGVDSYYVLINSERGSVTRDMPAHNGFNHAIVAIQLPEGLNDPALVATIQHPKLGKLLFFDPTNELIPFGANRWLSAGELRSIGDPRWRRTG